MQHLLEQRYKIKFCLKLDVYLAKSGVFLWHQAFLEGWEEVADEDCAGRPLNSKNNDNVTHVCKVLNSDHRLSICLIAHMLNLLKSAVPVIVMMHLNMSKVCAKMVPEVHTDDQKLWQVEVCQENLNMYESDPQFLINLITGDESWIFEYDPKEIFKVVHVGVSLSKKRQK
ncbi:hypothetical protein QYM36_001247 [Artemia franciscana]|uniref:Uncharacterized protein n=1 Tax=Artemia franciscana TaxID=6661 RepID=A0AA88IQ73_ARTSF|nr:hypothetical protein QYM36_001247 [Artemia franciscana]